MIHSLLKRIAASPHDRAARLVYADWLEERGVAWATLWREDLRYTPVLLRSPMSDRTGWGDGDRKRSVPGDGLGRGACGTEVGSGVGAGSYFVTDGYFGDGSGRGIKGQPGGNGDGAGLCGDHRGDGCSHAADGWLFLGANG